MFDMELLQVLVWMCCGRDCYRKKLKNYLMSENASDCKIGVISIVRILHLLGMWHVEFVPNPFFHCLVFWYNINSVEQVAFPYTKVPCTWQHISFHQMHAWWSGPQCYMLVAFYCRLKSGVIWVRTFMSE